MVSIDHLLCLESEWYGVSKRNKQTWFVQNASALQDFNSLWKQTLALYYKSSLAVLMDMSVSPRANL